MCNLVMTNLMCIWIDIFDNLLIGQCERLFRDQEEGFLLFVNIYYELQRPPKSLEKWEKKMTHRKNALHGEGQLHLNKGNSIFSTI